MSLENLEMIGNGNCSGKVGNADTQEKLRVKSQNSDHSRWTINCSLSMLMRVLQSCYFLVVLLFIWMIF